MTIGALSAWRWDYSLETARDILRYYGRLARRRHPGDDEATLTDWTVAAYHQGLSRLNKDDPPDSEEYVQTIRKLVEDKPWEE